MPPPFLTLSPAEQKDHETMRRYVAVVYKILQDSEVPPIIYFKVGKGDVRAFVDGLRKVAPLVTVVESDDLREHNRFELEAQEADQRRQEQVELRAEMARLRKVWELSAAQVHLDRLAEKADLQLSVEHEALQLTAATNFYFGREEKVAEESYESKTAPEIQAPEANIAGDQHKEEVVKLPGTYPLKTRRTPPPTPPWLDRSSQRQENAPRPRDRSMPTTSSSSTIAMVQRAQLVVEDRRLNTRLISPPLAEYDQYIVKKLQLLAGSSRSEGPDAELVDETQSPILCIDVSLIILL
jgi:hypothetical protein